jgi:hypothetical protein
MEVTFGVMAKTQVQAKKNRDCRWFGHYNGLVLSK